MAGSCSSAPTGTSTSSPGTVEAGATHIENGQDRNSLLGKTLRIDPNLNGRVHDPSSNPYPRIDAGLGEIWSIGLRNPWRASFDRETDALWIADVGQGSYEEINRERAGAGGRNYGWDCREGFQHPYRDERLSGSTFQQPLVEYGHVLRQLRGDRRVCLPRNVFPDLRGTTSSATSAAAESGPPCRRDSPRR